jgi:hypothetical protein
MITSICGGIEIRRGGSHLSDDATPVRVLPEDRGLEQGRSCHGAGDFDGVGFAGGAAGGDGDVVVGAFGVDVELVHEVEAEFAQQGGELVRVDVCVVGAGGHEDDGVVRRHAAVGVEAVEGLARRGTQSLVETSLGRVSRRW